MEEDLLERALRLKRAGVPFVLATVVRADRPTSAKPGDKAIVTGDRRMVGWIGGSCARPTVLREASKALADGQPRLVRLSPPEKLGRGDSGTTEVPLTCVSGGALEIYLEAYMPKPHLVVIGHFPVCEALVGLGKQLGYHVTAMSPQGDEEQFSLADGFYAHLDVGSLKLEQPPFIVVASHGNYDEEALEAALKQTDSRYVALVSSKKRSESVARDLERSGVSPERLRSLKVPAGLDIGARTPQEIALSILAEIVALRRSRIVERQAKTEEERQTRLARDPVCGMEVDPSGAMYTSEHEGQIYYFCASGCQRTFIRQPKDYLVSG